MISETTRKLITYSIGARRLQETSNFLEVLVPFAKAIATLKNTEQFQNEVFLEEMKSQFGLEIPPESIVEISKIFVSSNLLVIGDVEEKPIRYYWNQTESSENDVDTESIRTKITQFFDEFENFAKSSGDLFASYSREQLEEILLDFLVLKIPELETANIHFQSLQQIVDKADERKNLNQESYLCSRFFETLKASHSELHEWVREIADIALLAHAIKDFGGNRPQPKISQTKKSGTQFIVDTGVALDLLGLTTPAKVTSTRTTLEHLRKLGCGVQIFDTTIAELRSGLKTMLKTSYADRYGDVHVAMASGAVATDYVKHIILHAETEFENLGVKTLPCFFNDKQKKFFGTEAGLKLRKYVSGVHSQALNDNAIKHDMEAIAWIITKRAQVKQPDFLKASFIFLTHNYRLATASLKYAKENRETSYVLTDKNIVTRLWLMGNGQTRLTISDVTLMKNCAKVSAANPTLLNNVQETLKDIDEKKAGQYEAIVHTPRHIQPAMDALFFKNVENITDKEELAEAIYENTLDKMRDTLNEEENINSETEREYRTEAYLKLVKQEQKKYHKEYKRKLMLHWFLPKIFALFLSVLLTLVVFLCIREVETPALTILIGTLAAVLGVSFRIFDYLIPKFSEEKLVQKLNSQLLEKIKKHFPEPDWQDFNSKLHCNVKNDDVYLINNFPPPKHSSASNSEE